jgi:hypothetical protein
MIHGYVEISYKSYCFYGAARNPNFLKIDYHGLMRYFSKEGYELTWIGDK